MKKEIERERRRQRKRKIKNERCGLPESTDNYCNSAGTSTKTQEEGASRAQSGPAGTLSTKRYLVIVITYDYSIIFSVTRASGEGHRLTAVTIKVQTKTGRAVTHALEFRMNDRAFPKPRCP